MKKGPKNEFQKCSFSPFFYILSIMCGVLTSRLSHCSQPWCQLGSEAFQTGDLILFYHTPCTHTDYTLITSAVFSHIIHQTSNSAVCGGNDGF